MNLRNLQVFGISRKTKVLIAVFIVLIIAGVSFFIFGSKEGAAPEMKDIEESEQSQPLTGAATTGAPTFTQEEQPEPLPEPEKQSTYTEYVDSCAIDIKHAEDDIVDINSYMPEEEKALADEKSSYDQKKADLEAKIADLESQLETLKTDLGNIQSSSESSIKLLEEKFSASKASFEAAQKKLEDLKSTCKKK